MFLWGLSLILWVCFLLSFLGFLGFSFVGLCGILCKCVDFPGNFEVGSLILGCG